MQCKKLNSNKDVIKDAVENLIKTQIIMIVQI